MVIASQLLVLSESQAAWSWQLVSEAQRMQAIEVVVDSVVTIEDSQEGPGPTVRLGNGATYFIDRQDPLLKLFSEILLKKKEAGRVVYMEVDPNTRKVRDVGVPDLRRIQSVASEPVGDRLAVQIRRSPARHFVSTGCGRFEAIRRALAEASRSGEPILVTVRTGSTEILDARKPAAGYVTPIM